MNKFIVLIITSLIIMTSCQQTDLKIEKKSKSTIEKIIERKQLRIGTTEQYFPFTFMNNKKELKGIDIYIGNKLAKELGVEAKFIKYSITDLGNALKNDKIDIILSGYSITTDRNKDFLFTNSYYQTGKAIISKVKEITAGNKDFINKKEITLVTIRKSSSLEFIKNNYPKATILTEENILNCKDILFSGKADGFVGDYEVCENMYFSNQNDGDYRFRNLGTSLDHEFIGAAVSPKDYLFYNLVNNFIKKIDSQDMNNAIEKAWLEYGN